MKTVTYDEAQWQLVPIQATEGMYPAGQDVPEPRAFGAVYSAMLAAAPSAPAVEQQSKINAELLLVARYALEYIDGIPKDIEVDASGFDRDWANSVVGRAKLVSPQAADTDKVREALKDLYNAVDSCVDLTPEVMRKARSALESTMAAQAPVREVPEDMRKAMEQMHHALSVAEGYMDAVCFNTTNPKKRNNYAGGLRIIRDAMTAYEDLPLPAAPVQKGE